jgi:hypothetical protein
MGGYRMKEKLLTEHCVDTKSVPQKVINRTLRNAKIRPSKFLQLVAELSGYISDFDDPLADQLLDQLSCTPDQLVDKNLVRLVNLQGPRLARWGFAVARLEEGTSRQRDVCC